MPLLFSACNPSRKLLDGEFLLHKNYIVNKNYKLDEKEIENYIKQKPNRKILVFFSFHLWLHNMANEDRIIRKRTLLNKKRETLNVKRLARRKKIKKNKSSLIGEWLVNKGEPPVIMDTFLVQKTTKQIKLLLNNKGYFNGAAYDSVYYFKHRKKANVYYKIKTSEPFTINRLKYKIEDGKLENFILRDSIHSIIKNGDNYDADKIHAERDRIANFLNNKGYYLFTKDYIYFEVDTSINNAARKTKMVNITMSIKNYAEKHKVYADSIVESPHKQFRINAIYIQPDFVSKQLDLEPKDTGFVNDFIILCSSKLQYKNKVLLNNILIHKNDFYQLQNVETTYKRLSELKAFKTINIFFTPKDSNSIDCYIQLTPVFKQSFSVETEGTNRSGNLGISSSFVFQNRNLFHGAEILELSLKGGIEAQRTFKDETNVNDINKPVNLFNTMEFGPEMKINIPRFLLPFKVNPSVNSNPKTVFTSFFNFQRRPDYTRTISNFSLGYTWRETVKKRHTINPIVIDYVDVDLKDEFQDYLINKVQNRFIINSFNPHLTSSTTYSFTYDEQDIMRKENFSFLKINVESSGNLLRAFSDLTNSLSPNTIKVYTNEHYKIIGIRYAQYVRMDADYRFYINTSEINKIVFRFVAGIGVPLKNFPVLPFERSFFSGGANGIRSWQSRTLGPGSYTNKIFSSDQFGDGQLEANMEYRLKLFRIINGAFFIDAGNTWLRQPDEKRLGGDFQLNRFYKEIAIGGGFGIRADFNFIIIRLDIGLKIRDPQFAEDKRWVINNLFKSAWKKKYEVDNEKKYSFLAFNIGIGYPF